MPVQVFGISVCMIVTAHTGKFLDAFKSFREKRHDIIKIALDSDGFQVVMIFAYLKTMAHSQQVDKNI